MTDSMHERGIARPQPHVVGPPMNTSVRIEPGDLWVQFRLSLRRRLHATSDEAFERAWASSRHRTTFLLNELLPTVADDLGMTTKSELFRVDMAMGRQPSGAFVPFIWIESENSVHSADYEVRKLAALASPLKVLFVCCEWDNTPGAWPHGGLQDERIEGWTNIMRAHGDAWESRSVFAIVVAEWNVDLRFYATAFDGVGVCVDRHEILFERPMATSTSLDAR